MDGQPFAAAPQASPLRRRSRLLVVNRETPASFWRKSCSALSVRGGDMNPLEHEEA